MIDINPCSLWSEMAWASLLALHQEKSQSVNLLELINPAESSSAKIQNPLITSELIFCLLYLGRYRRQNNASRGGEVLCSIKPGTFFCMRVLVCDELWEWTALCTHEKAFKETASVCQKAQNACEQNNYFSLYIDVLLHDSNFCEYLSGTRLRQGQKHNKKDCHN